MAERVKVECSLTSRVAGCEGPQKYLKGPHQNELLSDAPQNRGKRVACRTTVPRNLDQSIFFTPLCAPDLITGCPTAAIGPHFPASSVSISCPQLCDPPLHSRNNVNNQSGFFPHSLDNHKVFFCLSFCFGKRKFPFQVVAADSVVSLPRPGL
ncbi:hypothetical protein GOODEAATRI_034186 [Goodea atripinnis]|uniref:Uncharacterized protein n=1 Tax=Goodea atripinnis TaxID=208336 RepID=A0ABV0NQE7_9TELE